MNIKTLYIHTYIYITLPLSMNISFHFQVRYLGRMVGWWRREGADNVGRPVGPEPPGHLHLLLLPLPATAKTRKNTIFIRQCRNNSKDLQMPTTFNRGNFFNMLLWFFVISNLCFEKRNLNLNLKLSPKLKSLADFYKTF